MRLRPLDELAVRRGRCSVFHLLLVVPRGRTRSALPERVELAPHLISQLGAHLCAVGPHVLAHGLPLVGQGRLECLHAGRQRFGQLGLDVTEALFSLGVVLLLRIMSPGHVRLDFLEVLFQELVGLGTRDAWSRSGPAGAAPFG